MRRYVEVVAKWLQILKSCDNTSISEIAEATGLRIGTVSEYLRDLEYLKLVELQEIRAAPRKVICRKTERGKMFQECLEKVFSGISA